MDATGPGLTLAEYTADEFGHDMIHQVILSRGWYAEFMPKMVKNFEDDQYDLPRDVNIDEDLRAVEDVDGIPRVPEVNTRDLKEPELYRHGDFAVSLVLGEFAAVNLVTPTDHMSDGAGAESNFEDFIYG